MSLPSYLTRPLRWLPAGYPSGAPRHGCVPLIGLMPSQAAHTGNSPGTGESPVPLTPRTRRAARNRKERKEAATSALIRRWQPVPGCR
jgi:hypothetical protein